MPNVGERVGPENRTINVLIADRNLLYRSGLAVVLSAEPDISVVGEAADIGEAMAQAAVLRPHVLILASSLAAASSSAVLRDTKCTILLLAQEETDEQLQLAMNAGARAYMLKSSLPAELVAGIRQLAWHGEEELIGLSKIVPDLQALRNSTGQGQRAAELTSREHEVIRLLADGRTARESAAELGVSVKTIEAHKLNLMRKFDVHDRASLIAFALEAGFIPKPALP